MPKKLECIYLYKIIYWRPHSFAIYSYVKLGQVESLWIDMPRSYIEWNCRAERNIYIEYRTTLLNVDSRKILFAKWINAFFCAYAYGKSCCMRFVFNHFVLLLAHTPWIGNEKWGGKSIQQHMGRHFRAITNGNMVSSEWWEQCSCVTHSLWSVFFHS